MLLLQNKLPRLTTTFKYNGKDLESSGGNRMEADATAREAEA